MKTQNIAVCGSPYTGKSTIINLIQDYGTDHVYLPKPEGNRPNITMNMRFKNTNLIFKAKSGAYSEQEETIQNTIRGANLIIYVLDPCRYDGSHLNFNQDYHTTYLEMHSRASKELHVHWSHIPWILVLNKLDLAQNKPPEADIFPKELFDRMIHCIAPKGIGIDKLWTRVTESAQL